MRRLQCSESSLSSSYLMRLSTVAIRSKKCVLAVGCLFRRLSGALLLFLVSNWLQKLLDYTGSVGNAEGGLVSLIISLLYILKYRESACPLNFSSVRTTGNLTSPRILSSEPEDGPFYKRVNRNLVFINVVILLSFLLTKAY
jgi:hypothetical protein